MENIKLALKHIKHEVKRQGYTYESIAALFGKSEAWFGSLMAGRRRISLDVLYALAEKLGVDIHSLLPSKNEAEKKLSLEEYMRQIAQEEIEKSNKQKEAK